MLNRDLLEFCKGAKSFIYKSLALNIFRLGFSIAFAYLLSMFLTNVVTGVSFNYIYIFILIIAVSFFKRFFIIKAGYYNFKVVEIVKQKLRDKFYKKIVSLSGNYKENYKTQELTHLLVEAIEQLEVYYGSYITQFYYCMISPIVLFLFLQRYDLYVSVVLLIFSPVIPLFLLFILKMVKKTQKKYWSKYANVGNLFLDSLMGLTTLKIFNADKRREKEIEDVSEGFRKQTMRLLAMQLNTITIIDLIAYGVTSYAIIKALMHFKEGSIPVFSLFMVIFLAFEFFIPMKSLTSLFHVAMTGVTASDEIIKFLKIDSHEAMRLKEFPKDKDINIKKLNFKYEDDKFKIEDLDMLIKKNELTAIIGPSGSGKSTIANIISNEIYLKDMIYIGETDLTQILNDEISKNIVKISQDSHIFRGTVRYNLFFNDLSLRDEEAIKLLKKFKIWDFLEKREGLDTILLSNGKNISGGQAQRILIARALLYDGSIYIFDEATSNIDVESEKIILDIIEELKNEKTVIYISHKLDTSKFSDNIYVMKEGKIVQKGNHSELINEDGLYKELYKEQIELLEYRGEKYDY